MEAVVNGQSIYYETLGQGRPLVCLHGGLGLDHTYLRPWLDPLAERFQLVFPDISGNGRSPRDSFEGVTHETWIDEIDGVRAHLGFEKIALLGHSYGGFLAQEYALKYPHRLDALICACSSPVVDHAAEAIANAQARGTQEQVDALLAGLSGPLASDADFLAWWQTIMPLYFHRYDPALAARLLDPNGIYSVGAFNHAFGVCIHQFNVEPRLGEINVPALVVSGDDDYILGPGPGGRIVAGVPGAEHIIIEKTGHFPFVEAPDAFLAAVGDWLATQDGARS